MIVLNWTPEDLKNLYTRSLETSSMDRQALHLSEEMSECVIEVSKLIRGRTTYTSHLAEEIADVMIMLDEMRVLFGIPDSEVKDLIDIKLEKFSMRVDNNNVSLPVLPTTAYKLYSLLRHAPCNISEDLDMDLRDLICKSFLAMTSLDQITCFVDHFVKFKVTFGLCYQVLTMIQTTCINTGSGTLAHFGFLQKIAPALPLYDAIDKLVVRAREVNEDMKSEVVENYLKPFVEHVTHAKDNQCREQK